MTKVADKKYFMKKIFDKDSSYFKLINKNDEILYMDLYSMEYITLLGSSKRIKIIEFLIDNIESIEDIHIDEQLIHGILFPFTQKIYIIKVDQSLEALIQLFLI